MAIWNSWDDFKTVLPDVSWEDLKSAPAAIKNWWTAGIADPDLGNKSTGEMLKDRQHSYDSMSYLTDTIKQDTFNNKGINTYARSEVDKITGEVVEYNEGETTRNFSLMPGAEAPKDAVVAKLAETRDTFTPMPATTIEEAKNEINNMFSPVNNNKITVDTTPLAKAQKAQTNATNRISKEIETGRNENWELAKQQAKGAFNLSIASNVAGVIEDYMGYQANKKQIEYAKQNLAFEKQMAEKNMEIELNNYETAINEQLADSFANLDQTAAYQNVDLRSQALSSTKEQAVESAGKDIKNLTTQQKLQKAAMNLKMTYNINQLNNQKAALKSGFMSGVASRGIQVQGAYDKYKSYDKTRFKTTMRADITGKK